MPEKLHELQRLWIVEPTRNNVLPMDDRGAERSHPNLAGRLVLVRGNSQLLARGLGGLNENALVNIKNKSRSVTARVMVPTVNKAFTGTVQLVVIEADSKEEANHLVSREHLLHILLAHQ